MRSFVVIMVAVCLLELALVQGKTFNKHPYNVGSCDHHCTETICPDGNNARLQSDGTCTCGHAGLVGKRVACDPNGPRQCSDTICPDGNNAITKPDGSCLCVDHGLGK